MFRKALFVILVLLPQFLFAHHGGSEYALNQTVEFMIIGVAATGSLLAGTPTKILAP